MILRRFDDASLIEEIKARGFSVAPDNRFDDADLIAELRARGYAVLPAGRTREVESVRYVSVFDAQQIRAMGAEAAHRAAIAGDLAAMTASFLLDKGCLPISEEEEPGSLRLKVSTKLTVVLPDPDPNEAEPEPKTAPAPKPDPRSTACEQRKWDEGRGVLDAHCYRCGSRDRNGCLYRTPPGAPIDPRPALCRDRLQAAGKPHPKSGCEVAGCGGVFGERVCQDGGLGR